MKLLIVDDEQIILNGIANKKHWTDVEIEDVYTASNVQEALNVLNDNAVDIVITDITMPGETGLSLCEKINEMYPEIYLIILSGYDNFDYAQEALKFGVREYLLKPATIEKIKESVVKAIKYKEKKRADKEKVSAIKDELKFSNNVARAYRLISLAMGEKDVFRMRTDMSWTSMLSMPYDGNTFALIGISQINNIDMWGTDAELVVQYAVLNISEEFIGKYCDNFIITYDLDKNIVILLNDIKNADWKESLIKTVLENIDVVINIEAFENISLDEIHSSYEKYKEKSADKSNIRGVSAWNKKLTLETSEFMNRLFETINVGDDVAAKNSINAFFDMCKDENVEYLRSICVMFLSLTMYKSRLAKEEGETEAERPTMNTEISTLRATDDKNELKSIFTIYIENILRGREGQDVISKVKNYVSEHLNENIGLSQAAAVACMSTNYFSNFFKKETGVTYSDYVAFLKLKKAKEMLRDKDKKIVNIAYMLGFRDQHYFSSFFKKHEGINPTEYRNKIFSGDENEI